MDDGFQEVFFLQKMLETPVFFMVDLKTDFFGNGIISYIYITPLNGGKLMGNYRIISRKWNYTNYTCTFFLW